MDNPAIEIVDAVLAELMTRKGIGDELRMIEADHPEGWNELKATLLGRVEAVLQSSPAR